MCPELSVRQVTVARPWWPHSIVFHIWTETVVGRADSAGTSTTPLLHSPQYNDKTAPLPQLHHGSVSRLLQ